MGKFLIIQIGVRSETQSLFQMLFQKVSINVEKDFVLQDDPFFLHLHFFGLFEFSTVFFFLSF